jgi:hypothetical protein
MRNVLAAVSMTTRWTFVVPPADPWSVATMAVVALSRDVVIGFRSDDAAFDRLIELLPRVIDSAQEARRKLGDK